MDILKTIAEINNFNDRVKVVMSKVKNHLYYIIIYLHYLGK